MTKPVKQWASQDLEALQKYNALDTIVTARAYAEIKRDPEWTENPYLKRQYEVNEALSHIAPKMYARGFWVNELERQRLDRELQELYAGKKATLLQLVNDSQYNASPDDMRALLFKRHAKADRRNLGLADPPIGKAGRDFWTDEEQTRISVDQGTLLKYYVDPFVSEEAKTIIKAYWEAAAPRKARNTYVSGEKVLQAIGSDGRLRPGYNEFGANTARWTCRQPNLFNLSETKGETSLGGELPNIRAMYGAAPGMKLVHADWSQQELRVMRAVAPDSALKQALESSDVYWYDAQFCFAELRSVVYNKDNAQHKNVRKGMKITHLGSQYGASLPVIFSQALKQDRGLTYTAMQLFHSKWKKLYHQTTSYWTEEFENVRAVGFSEGRILHGRRYYPEEPDITETSNYPIQRTAGEMAALALIEIDKRLSKYCPGAGLVMYLYDAVDVECYPSQEADVRRILEDVMVGPWEIDGNGGHVSLEAPVDIKSGTSWAGL